MPRLLFITQTAYIGGGMEEWLWSLYNAMDSVGWKCAVGLVKGARFHRPAEYLKAYPFRCHLVIDGSLGYAEQREKSLIKAFEAFRPDIVVCFNLADALYAAVNWKIGCNNSVRIVYVIHSMSPRVMNDVRRCASNIDLVASVSARGCDLAQELCGDQPPTIRHLPTGVPAPVRKTTWHEAPFTAGYVGRLDSDEKRIMDLVELLQAAGSGFCFEIAGKGPAENALKHALAPWIEEGRIVFHGQLDREKLYHEIYPRLQALILFSPAEGGPIVAWEAMRHGVVPVVSNFQGRAEEGVICHGKNALVFPIGDILEAAELLAELREDQAHWQALSKAAVAIPDAYHLETFGDRWKNALEKTLLRAVRLDRSRLYLFESSGKLSYFVRSPLLRFWLWKTAGRRFPHAEAGGEWPHSYNGQIKQKK